MSFQANAFQSNAFQISAITMSAVSLIVGVPVTVAVDFHRHDVMRMTAPNMRVGVPQMADPRPGTVFAGGGDMRGLPQENPLGATPYYRVVNAIWPDLLNQQAIIAPARNGVNRDTGKLLQGWDHVEQSIRVIFMTPYHQRIMRRWVGSFVPMILGRSTVPRIITRFFWAIATDLDMNEPNYRVKQVYYMGDALSGYSPLPEMAAADMIRLGWAIFRHEGVYRPRAHLGDMTPFEQKAVGLISRGQNIWDVTAP